jgi:Mg2+-importing ATPase
MLVTPLSMAAVGALLPFTPLVGVLGFAALPLSFFLILMGMVVVYLGLIEAAKARFYARERNRPRRTPPSHEERRRRRVHRRASRFIARQVA